MRRVFVTTIEPASVADSMGRVLDRIWKPAGASPRIVAIKINLCDYRRAESGATMDPRVLGGLLAQLGRRCPGARLAIVENDATSVQADSLFRLLGIEAVAHAHGAEVVNVGCGEWVTRQLERPRALPEVEVPRIVAEADLFINVAKLKTNSFTKMTGCLKNMFGLMRPKRKTPYHHNLADVLIDLTRAMPPHLCLVDGLIGMEGLGAPAFGRPRPTGLVIGGTDAVAVDACAARIMGFWPRLVGHIRRAHAAGLGTLRYELETDIEGFRYRDHRFEFSRVQFLLRSMIRGRVGIGV